MNLFELHFDRSLARCARSRATFATRFLRRSSMFSLDFPWTCTSGFLGVSLDFPQVFPGFTLHFPWVCSWIFLWFYMDSLDFPQVFLTFFPSLPWIFPLGFPWISPLFDPVLAPFCLHFGSILTLFWNYFGSIWLLWGCPGEEPRNVSQINRF